MPTIRSTLLFVALSASLAVVLRNMPAPAEVLPERAKVDFKARPFPLNQVKLLDGPFKDAMDRDREYLHALESDRLLHTWRLNAGLPSSAEPLGGWEQPDCQVRGHTLGHYLSACALMYASTGDEQLKAKADAIIAELGKCQKALGESGYLSAFPEDFVARAEKCQPVWAPFYTLHKLFAGLQDMAVYCDNRQALEIAEKMAGWLARRLDNIDDEQMQRMLDRTEQGGMNDTLANLYALTGNEKYLAMARRFDQRRYVDPLAEGQDKLQGEHANSFIPNMIGTARQYEMTGDPRDRRIAEFFWDEVTGKRCYCTGGTSNHEHWRTPPGILSMELGDFTQETCCTYNMLKLTRHLFCWDPQPKYADYYERALWTSILGTQDPQTGMMMYFVPLAPGRWKMFNLPHDSFWCCTGTGLENHAKYGDSIYFRGDGVLLVNQFIASQVDWKQQGVAVRQETDFPIHPGTSLVVETEQPTRFALKVRVPSWAKGVTARLNGKPLEVDAAPSTYLTVARTWQDGDRLDVSLPMRLHASPMPDDPTVVAFLYGPFVLAGLLGGEGLTEENTHTGENWYPFAEPAVAPPLVGSTARVDDWIKPVEGKPLAFQLTSQGEQFTLIPYHRLFGQRYVVYWKVFPDDGPAYGKVLEQAQRAKARAARRVDRVRIGERHSEHEHKLQGEGTQSGSHNGRAWRHAADGGWFSYELKVDGEHENTLVCTYWGSDSGNRSFDVLLDGCKIATQTLNADKPGEFFEVEHQLPEEMTHGKTSVVVRFEAHPGNFAGGLFGCEILRGE